MKIYAQELADGLSEKINASASVSYASVVEPSDASHHNTKKIKALASLEDSDLYYVQSILVSSSWNKNDDIFDKAEVWASKNSPEDKPTNLNHDENTIVGHITSNWPITEDGVLIDKDTPVENLPEKFHILTGSVIYKSYQGDELKARTASLIEEIEKGSKYVSMECYFKDFDYGVTDIASGEYKVIARNDDTAHMTKYLRAYGGAGEHENFKIGRVLRDITFSGKGFVDRPANPDSIIFNENLFSEKETLQSDEVELLNKDEEKISISENDGVIANELVTANTETIQMNEDTNKLTELESALSAKETELSDAVTSLNDCQAKNEAAVAEQTADLNTKSEEIETLKEAIAKLEADLVAANETIAGYKMKEEEMKKKEKKDKRMASLLDAGIETADAEALLEKFESVDDEAFDAMSAALAAKKAMPEDMEEEKKKEKKEKATEAEVVTEEILETAEEDTSAIDLAVGGVEEDPMHSTRADLINFVYSRLGKTLNKGE